MCEHDKQGKQAWTCRHKQRLPEKNVFRYSKLIQILPLRFQILSGMAMLHKDVLEGMELPPHQQKKQQTQFDFQKGAHSSSSAAIQ